MKRGVEYIEIEVALINLVKQIGSLGNVNFFFVRPKKYRMIVV